MKIIKASYEILNKEKIDGMEILKDIERIGRTCYKSEDKITEDSASKFVGILIRNGHEAMIEHNSITVKFICDRGVSHELVRHRIASFAQESTRYCNYSADKFGNELTVIKPIFWGDADTIAELEEFNVIEENGNFKLWRCAMRNAESLYFTLLEEGATPQEARTVLPNSLKTEIVMTMNIREWRHFFKLRCDPAAHPQMRELTTPLLSEMSELIPVVFGDIVSKYIYTDDGTNKKAL